MIPSLTINNFRLFKHLEIEKLARVNLITGKNNSGKSALLECVRLFSTEGSYESVKQVIKTRDINSSFSVNYIPDFFIYNLDRVNDEFTITDDENHLKFELLMLEKGTDGSLQRLEGDGSWPLDLAQGLIRTYNNIETKPLILLEHQGHGFGRKDNDQTPLCFYVSSSVSPHESYLPWWDKLSTPKHKQVLDCIRLILPDMEDFGAINKESKNRYFVVKLSTHDFPTPLSSYGEGVRRLLSIIIAMVSAQNNYLCIDEFENGIHYSVLPQLWETILVLAEKLNVQVFATTHSGDCVNAFQQALNESDAPDTGQLIRLKERKGEIKATLFDAEDLKVITSSNLEVR